MEVQNTVPRRMDGLGRVIIPRDIREALGWGDGTKLEMAISDIAVKSVIVREASASCSLCRRESENLMEIGNGFICPDCVAQIK